MDKISGELIDNKIIIKKSKDIGRLYNKSGFGKTISGNKLILNLIEGVFLLDDEKLRVFHKENEMQLQDIFKISAKHIPNFDRKYLIFKELRKRGYIIKLDKKRKEFDFYLCKKKSRLEEKQNLCLISTYSERNIINISKIKKIIDIANQYEGDLWFAIVDEEGDITYYEVSVLDLKGKISEHKFSKTKGILLENRVVIFDKKISKKLLDKEFFGKAFGKGLQLSLVEALYLMEKEVIALKDSAKRKISTLKQFIDIIKISQPDIELRYTVFTDLKKRGLIIKTGFKFGSHFRAYTKKPEETHAEYLIHVVDKSFKNTWAEICRAVRLAHSVNKDIIFARVDGSIIDYIKFGRLRP